MKICAISDTHMQHWSLKLPAADVLVHAGDACIGGSNKEWADFCLWWEDQKQFKHKIYVAGNHDWPLERNADWAVGLITKDGTHYLQDSYVTIGGNIFWGTPWQRPFHNWAFNREDVFRMSQFSKINFMTSVLISHAPPSGTLDGVDGEVEHLGDHQLSNVLDAFGPYPSVHIFGHIHSGYGVKIVANDPCRIAVNASICNEGYKPVNAPIVVHL